MLTNKNAAMLYAIKRFNMIPGKKALQKILYFANTKATTYSFQWNNFGPYSEELNYHFEDAAIDGIIHVMPKTFVNSNIKQYNMELSDKGLNVLESIPLERKVKKAIDFSFKILKNKSPRKMELLASVHYIVNDNDCNMDPTYIWELINMLKPEQGFTLGDVTQAIEELKQLKLL